MTIKDICIKYNLSQTELSKYFNIPLRTIQNWHSGSRKPPEYIIDMIIKILEYEQ
ncbi:MAG: helix-turn-helix domain-containing protein [Bacilli bacterium]